MKTFVEIRVGKTEEEEKRRAKDEEHFKRWWWWCLLVVPSSVYILHSHIHIYMECVLFSVGFVVVLVFLCSLCYAAAVAARRSVQLKWRNHSIPFGALSCAYIHTTTDVSTKQHTFDHSNIYKALCSIKTHSLTHSYIYEIHNTHAHSKDMGTATCIGIRMLYAEDMYIFRGDTYIRIVQIETRTSMYHGFIGWFVRDDRAQNDSLFDGYHSNNSRVTTPAEDIRNWMREEKKTYNHLVA